MEITWIRIHFFPVRIRIKIKWILSTASYQVLSIFTQKLVQNSINKIVLIFEG